MGRPMEYWYPWDYREWSTHARLGTCSHATKGILMDLQAILLNSWSGELIMPTLKLARLLRLDAREIVDALDDLNEAQIGMDICFERDPHEDINTDVTIKFPKIQEFINSRESALKTDRARKSGGNPVETVRKSVGIPMDFQRVSSEFPTIEENREEEKRVEKKKKSTPRQAGDYSPEFEAWWTLYPKKSAKGGAWKEWKTLNPDADLQAHMASAVQEQIEWRKLAAGFGKDVFVPPWLDPERWIKRRKWEDEPPPELQGASGSSPSTRKAETSDYEALLAEIEASGMDEAFEAWRAERRLFGSTTREEWDEFCAGMVLDCDLRAKLSRNGSGVGSGGEKPVAGNVASSRMDFRDEEIPF